jgi:hypothetical protein
MKQEDEGGTCSGEFIVPPSAFILAVLRDGVTGNTSGFELEDEGSTPSPAANSFLKFAKRYFDCHSRNK